MAGLKCSETLWGAHEITFDLTLIEIVQIILMLGKYEK